VCTRLLVYESWKKTRVLIYILNFWKSNFKFLLSVFGTNTCDFSLAGAHRSVTRYELKALSTFLVRF
jgi:hypothetical protein